MKVLFFATILLGLASSVYPEACPLSQDILPCRCKSYSFIPDIYVECDDATINLEDIQKVLKSLLGKENVHIDLTSVNLGKAPFDLYKGIGIKTILLSGCKLERPEDESILPFSGLEDTLEDLHIYSTITVKNVPEGIYLGHLRRLKLLVIWRNTIPELSNDWFGGESTSMEYIDMNSNGIEKLGDKAFAKFSNLEYLGLDSNELSHIQRSMFPSSALHLTELYLSDNNLTSLPEDIFSNMPSLETITLEENKITRLEKNTWKNIWEQLDYIDLDDNPLHCDSHMHWMFDHRVPEDILGTCESPPDKKGISLEKFIQAGKGEIFN